jgi:putative ABC transport system permease protein
VILGNCPFIVVGVMDRLPPLLAGQTSMSGHYVLVPWNSALDRFGKFSIILAAGSYTAEKVDVSYLILQMKDEDAVLQGAEVARSLLARYHPDRAEFHVRVPLEEIELQKKQKRLWNIMFLVIASVSLLVGGIGIMNIMLASVTERTREIGIRRAVGASQVDIVWQFLLESVALTIVGGLIGVGIGVCVPWVVEQFLGIRTVISTVTLVLPFAMAVIVGLVSGLYPALRAAKLDPIVALRHE